MRILLMLIHFAQEMIFDSKDEYNIKSPKFNLKKVMVTVILLFSLFTNLFLTYSFVKVAGKYLALQEQHEKLTNPIPEETAKNKDPASSNSQKP